MESGKVADASNLSSRNHGAEETQGKLFETATAVRDNFSFKQIR